MFVRTVFHVLYIILHKANYGLQSLLYSINFWCRWIMPAYFDNGVAFKVYFFLRTRGLILCRRAPYLSLAALGTNMPHGVGDNHVVHWIYYTGPHICPHCAWENMVALGTMQKCPQVRWTTIHATGSIIGTEQLHPRAAPPIGRARLPVPNTNRKRLKTTSGKKYVLNPFSTSSFFFYLKSDQPNTNVNNDDLVHDWILYKLLYKIQSCTRSKNIINKLVVNLMDIMVYYGISWFRFGWDTLTLWYNSHNCVLPPIWVSDV